MNKFVIISFLLTYLGVFSQNNTLLDRNFWTKETSIAQVQSEIKKGNSPSELNASAFDPVSIAIMQSAPMPTILFLLEQEGNYIDKLTHDSRTYLHWAAFSGNIPLIEYLIEQGSDLYAKDSRGMIPLAFAAERGMTHTAVFDIFFKKGIHPLQRYKNGATLMHIAIHNDTDLQLTDYLITHGLSIKDTDKDGSTLLDYACKKGNINQIKALLQRGVPYTHHSLLFAAMGARRFSNSIDIYQYLIQELKVDVNATDKQGQNALHKIASRENQKEIIAYLIRQKINLNQIDSQGNSPFMIACKGKDTEVLDLLFPTHTQIDNPNKQGQTPLSYALEYGSASIVAFLLKKNHSTQTEDALGNNLAYYWLQSYRSDAKFRADFLEKLKLLQQYSMHFNKIQHEGTLYHLAVIKNDLDLLKILSTLNIDINQQNPSGETALIKAAMVAKDDTILRYLIELGADKNLTTLLNETAYDLAKENEILLAKNISVEFLK